ncbi:MAG: hypothetical protein ABWX92_09730 [Mycetocola sp.]
MSQSIINPESAKPAGRTRTRVRLAAAAVASIALLAAATPAWAATNTITVAPVASLTVKVAISVPVTIVCDPLPEAGSSSTVNVKIKQANGKQISTASGEVRAYPGDANMLICDGSTQNNVVVQALPDPGSGPFRNGAAYVTASFTYQAGSWMGVTESGNTAGSIKLR